MKRQLAEQILDIKSRSCDFSGGRQYN